MDSALEQIRKAATEALKTHPMLLGCHQDFLLDMMGRRWAFNLEGQFEMAEDPVDGLRFFDKRDDSHLVSTRRTDQWIPLVDLTDHLGSSF
jgi:hypothetical protein